MAVMTPPKFQIYCTAEAKRRFGSLIKKQGMTETAAAGRVFIWFMSLPEPVQAEVLGQYPDEVRADVAAGVIRRMLEGADDDLKERLQSIVRRMPSQVRRPKRKGRGREDDSQPQVDAG